MNVLILIYAASVLPAGWWSLSNTLDDLRRDRRHAERGEWNADAVTWWGMIWRGLSPLIPGLNTLFATLVLCGWVADVIDRFDRPVIRRANATLPRRLNEGTLPAPAPEPSAADRDTGANGRGTPTDVVAHGAQPGGGEHG